MWHCLLGFDLFETIGLLRLLGRLRLSLLRLVLGQGSVAVHDAVEARHIVILPLVRSLQLLHHGVHLRLLPCLVLLHAALVQRLSLPQKHLVLSLKVAAAVVRSASQRVTLATERTQESVASSRRGEGSTAIQDS